MPLFQIDIQKDVLGYNWTNVYVVEAADLSVAHSAANTVLVTAEQDIHTTLVTINHVRTSTLVAGDNSFKSSPRSVQGTLASDGNALPLFNVVRVDIGAEEGRPSRKYYRCGLGSGNVASGFEWDSVKVNAVQAAIEVLIPAMFDAGAQLVDPDGSALGEVITDPKIGMHQLRRGSKRRTEAVLREGAAGPSRKRETVAQRVARVEAELFELRKANPN